MNVRTRPPVPRHRTGPPEEMRTRIEALMPSGPVLPGRFSDERLDGGLEPHRPAPETVTADAASDLAEAGTTEAAPDEPETGAPATEAEPETAVGGEDEAGTADAQADGSGATGGNGAVGQDGAAGREAAPAAAGGPVAFPDAGAGALPSGAPLPAPAPPRYRAPDLNAIRAPVLRPPPPAAQAKSAGILRRTGSTPSQHHADIQAALFRASETARAAQRQMVQEVESLAVDTRWSLEDLAARVDGIVLRCTAMVAGAARAAYAEIEAAAERHMTTIRETRETAGADMAAREAQVRGQVVEHLTANGSAEIAEANRQLVAAYNVYVATVPARIVQMADGTEPQPIRFGDSQSSNASPPPAPAESGAATDGTTTTFTASGEKIVQSLFTAPQGDAGGGASDPYRRAYIDRAKAGATPFLAREHEEGWTREARTRSGQYASADNRNRFVLAAFGLTAPTETAMNVDAEQYQKTLSDEVYRQHGPMSRAQEAAISRIESTLRGPRSVQAFFDPANPRSMPARINHGLRETGQKIKAALLSQARLLQAGFRAGIADMAVAYPDVVLRLEGLLAGEDMLDARELVPRIEAAAGSIGKLRAGHVGAVAQKAGEAVGQARSGLREQEAQLLSAAGEAVNGMLEHKLKALFEFELMTGFYTGEFGDGLRQALDRVTGYADQAAKRLIAPIRAAEVGGTVVERAAISHFNQQLAGEWSGYLQSVNGLGAALGQGEEGSSASQAKPFPRIEVDKTSELRQRVTMLKTALPEPRYGEAIGAGTIAVLAAPFSGGISLAAGGYAAYQLWRSIPDKSDAATALALPWPGALAINAQSQLDPVDPLTSKGRVEQIMSDADADKPRLLGLFSPNEGDAATARAGLIEGADRLWGVNDDAVQQLARSFSPSELSLLSDAQKTAMRNSIRSNLSGIQFQMTEAYIDGRPGRAAAIRLLDDLARARRKGDQEMQTFGRTVDSRLMAELQSTPGAYVPPELIAQFSDEMFIEMSALIPPEGTPGRTPPEDRARPDLPSRAALAPPADGTEPMMSVEPIASMPPAEPLITPGEDPLRAADFEARTAARARPPDANAARAARERFVAHATRDYAHHIQSGGHFGTGGYDDYAGGNAGIRARAASLPSRELAGGGRLHGDLVFQEMNRDVAASLRAYVDSRTSPEASNAYAEAQAVQALSGAESRPGGPSEDDIVRLSQTLGSPAVSLARARFDDAERQLERGGLSTADRARIEAQRDNAQADLRAAEREHGLMLVRIHARSEGRAPPRTPSEAEIEAARVAIAARVDRIGGNFERDLDTLGTDLTRGGAIDLAKGMRAATGGLGTYNALLTEVTANRRRSEFEHYFASPEARRDGISRESLGIGLGNQGLLKFTETSGDEAQQLEINMLGVPETDADRAEIAAVRARHQLIDGTGFIADFTMEGTSEKRDLENSRAALAERVHASLLASNDPHNPVPGHLRRLPASAMITPDGTINPEIRRFVTDRHGNFFGPGPTMASLQANIEVDASNYAAEIGRQESFFTGIVSALAIVASIALMFIPGVNLIAAGILVALLAGGATIALKAGLRGGRYGWEEAAVDVARTGIEAATAGVGGALGQAVKPGAGVLGKLSALGGKINESFGRVGGAIVREGMVSGTSGVANKALDDTIWTKGIANGLGELFKAGLHGLATGAVSGGVSEGLSVRAQKALAPGVAAGVNARGLNRLGGRLGPNGAEIVQEALSGSVGAMSSEGLNFLIDASEGHDRLSMERFLARIGPAGLRDLLSSGGKAAARTRMRSAYHAEKRRLMESDAPISDADARRLRRMAISAGEETYAGAGDLLGLGGAVRAHPRSDAEFRQQLMLSRQIIHEMPPDLARHAARLPVQDLERIRELRRAGESMSDEKRRSYVEDLAWRVPGLDAEAMMRDLDMTVTADRARQHEAQQANAKARQEVLAGLPPDLRDKLDDHAVDALAPLTPQLLARARRLIAAGKADEAAMQAFLGRVAEVEGADPAAVRTQVEALIAGRSAAGAIIKAQGAKARADLEAVLPAALKPLLADLSDADATVLHGALFAEGKAQLASIDTVREVLARHAPGIAPESLDALIGTAIASANRRAGARRTERQADDKARRLAQMDNVPEDLRPLMAHLADDDLMELRFAQQFSRDLPKARRAEMVARARRAATGLDTDALMAGIARTLAAPVARRPFFERFRQRRTLISFVPEAQRSAVRRTPILSVPDEVFAAYVRDHQGGGRKNAMTTRLNGEIVVIIRRGAGPLALREEGRHVLQLLDPSWQARLQGVDERALADWEDLPIARQAEMAQRVLEAEVAAHRDMLAMLDEQAAAAILPGTRSRLATERAMVETRLRDLAMRLAEVQALGPSQRLEIEAGRQARPEWLDEPARLYNAEPPEGAPLSGRHVAPGAGEALTRGPVESEPSAGGMSAAHLAELAVQGLKPDGKLAREYSDRADRVAARIAALDPETAAAVGGMLKAAAAQSAAADPANKNQKRSFRTLLRELDSDTGAAFFDRLAKVARGGDGFVPQHLHVVAQLLDAMTSEFGIAGRHYTTQMQFRRQIEAYTAMIDHLERIRDPGILKESRDEIANWLRQVHERRAEGKPMPKVNKIRESLKDFLESTAENNRLGTGLLTLADANTITPDRVLGLGDIDSDAGLNWKMLAEELGKLKTIPEEAGRREARFIELLTGRVIASKGGQLPPEVAAAERLYPIFKAILDSVDLGRPPPFGRGRSEDDIAVALYYAHTLMDLPDAGRRLDARAILRVLASPSFNEFREKMALGRFGAAEVRALRITPDILDALPLLHQLLTQGDATFSHQTADLHRSLMSSAPQEGRIGRRRTPGGEVEAQNFLVGAARMGVDAAGKLFSLLGRVVRDPSLSAPALQSTATKPKDMVDAYIENLPGGARTTARPEADFAQEAAQRISLDFSSTDPNAIHQTLRKIAEEAGVRRRKDKDNPAITLLVELEGLIKAGSIASAEVQTGPGMFYVRISMREGGELTGWVGNQFRMVVENGGTGGEEKVRLGIAGTDLRYVDITSVAMKVRSESGGIFNFFRAMADMLAGGELVPGLAVDPKLRGKLYNELALAAYLMFGIEVIRHPEAQAAAIMAMFLGTRLDAVEGGLGPEHVIFGDPAYRKQVMDILKDYFGQGAEKVALFDDEAANGLMKNIFQAERNRVDLESGGLFPSSIVQFLDYDTTLRAYSNGDLKDPAQIRFADAILRRYGQLFEMALESAGPDVIKEMSLGEDNQRLLHDLMRGNFGENPQVFDKLMARILAEMLRRLRTEGGGLS